MKYQITSDNIDLSPSMKALTEEKFARIENRVKNFPDDTKYARIVLNSAPEQMFTVKAKVSVSGHDYFSDETDYTLESALIRTVDELVKMMEKDKRLEDKKMLREKKELDEEVELQEMDYEEE